jgi:hypothetical protein
MITFGHVYLHERFITYDVCLEVHEGRPQYVASLSMDPRVQAVAAHPDMAVSLLMARLGWVLEQRRSG